MQNATVLPGTAACNPCCSACQALLLLPRRRYGVCLYGCPHPRCGQVSLIFANVSEADILLKDKIDGLAAKHPDRFKVHYVVDKPKW